MAEQDEEPPPNRRRESRPTVSFLIRLIIISNLCFISVMSLLLYMHSSDDRGDPEPGADSPSRRTPQAQKSPPALHFVDPADFSSYVLHRFEGVKASMT